MVLGLGVSHQVTVENWYDSKIDKPVTPDARVRRGRARDPARRGRRPRAQSSPPSFRFMGYEARAELPDLHRRAVAEHAPARRRDRRRRDALALQPRVHPRRRHARDPLGSRGGRPRAWRASTSSPRCPSGSPTTSRPAGRHSGRSSSPTCRCPSTARCSKRSGLRGEIAAFDEGMAAGDAEKAKAGISDAMLDALAGIGGPDQVHGGRRAIPARPGRRPLHRRHPPAPTSTARSTPSPPILP